jgi:hypothetical protein
MDQRTAGRLKSTGRCERGQVVNFLDDAAAFATGQRDRQSTVIGALGIEIGAANDLLTAAKLVLPRPSHGRANRTTIFRLRRS